MIVQNALPAGYSVGDQRCLIVLDLRRHLRRDAGPSCIVNFLNNLSRESDVRRGTPEYPRTDAARNVTALNGAYKGYLSHKSAGSSGCVTWN